MKTSKLKQFNLLIILLLLTTQSVLSAIEFYHNGVKAGSIKSQPNKLIYTSQTQQFYGNAELQETTISGNILISGNIAIHTQNGIASETIGNKSIYLAIIGGTTITLPPATNNQGKVYTIKKANFNVAANTIQTQNNETIDGATSVTLNSPQEALTLISDGSNWHIIHRYATHGAVSRKFEDSNTYSNKVNDFEPIYTKTIPADIPKGIYRITWYYEFINYRRKFANIEHFIFTNNKILSSTSKFAGFDAGDGSIDGKTGFGYAPLAGDGTDTLKITVRYQVGVDLDTVLDNQIRNIYFELTLIEPTL